MPYSQVDNQLKEDDKGSRHKAESNSLRDIPTLTILNLIPAGNPIQHI